MFGNWKILGLISLFIFLNVRVQGSDSLKYKKLELTAKVWGFAVFKTEKKLSSPDKELHELIKFSTSSESYEKYLTTITNWFYKVYKTDSKRSCKCDKEIPKSLNWVKDSIMLGKEFSDFLSDEAFYCSKSPTPQYSLNDFIPTFYEDKFTLKKSDTILTSNDYLLSGIKYWNFVNYFYPYAFDSTIMWNHQLKDIIISFDKLSDYASFYFTLLSISTKLNDGHARIYSSWATQHLFKFEVPFETEVYEDYAIVTRVDSVDSTIRINDLIVQINGRPISEHLLFWDKYLSTSTRGWFLHTVRNYIFSCQDSTLELTINRNGEHFTRKIILINSEEKGAERDNIIYNMNKDSIGYIDIGNLQLHHFPAIKNQLQKAKAIIVDARHYPNSTLIALSKWLIDEQKLFAYHSLVNPVCIGSCGLDSSLSNSNDLDKYQGIIILILDRSTISQGEYTAMAFLQSSNVITIGRPTAGSVGLTSMFTLPGKISCRISTSKVYFPNNQLVQQIGIKPDIDLSNNNDVITSDQIVDFAYKYIKKIILKRE